MPPSPNQSQISSHPAWRAMGTGRSAWPVSIYAGGAAPVPGPASSRLGVSPSLPPAVVSLGEHPELRRNLLPPLIIHTAATPMSLPKSSSTGLAEVLGPASRRTSSSGSAEPGAAHEMKSPVWGACGCRTVGDVQMSGGKRGWKWTSPRRQPLSHSLDKPLGSQQG